MYKRLKVKKGDQVVVIAGSSRGKEGRVLEVSRKDDRVLVEGVNMIKKHHKPSPTNPEGRIEEKEAPVHISNVMVKDEAGNATRLGRRRGEDGKLVRYSKKSNQEIK
ncbi:MAG: large subunit ribosomal protein L24 [Flavobacteriales bacterium]|jgi:large subunit ribosomal protein L24